MKQDRKYGSTLPEAKIVTKRNSTKNHAIQIPRKTWVLRFFGFDRNP